MFDIISYSKIQGGVEVSVTGNLVIVLQQILNQHSKESDIDYLIAEYLLRNLYRTDLTIGTISEECHISKASVTRFSQNIGYEGFSELKKDYDLVTLGRDEMKIDLIALNNDEDASVEAKTAKLQNEFDQVGKDIVQFNTEINLKQIEELCGLIHASNDVHIFSTLIPGDIGNILQNMLLNAGKFVECYPSVQDQYEASQRMAKNDLALFISLEGSHVMKRELTLSVTSSEATSVLITQNPEMKLGSLFDRIVPLGEHSLERSGKYKLLMFVEYLAHFYFNKYGK